MNIDCPKNILHSMQAVSYNTCTAEQ